MGSFEGSLEENRWIKQRESSPAGLFFCAGDLIGRLYDGAVIGEVAATRSSGAARSSEVVFVMLTFLHSS